MPLTHSLAGRCQRRDSGIKCLRGASSKGGRAGEATKKRPPLMTPLEWPESAIPRPWAMANGDGRRTGDVSKPDLAARRLHEPHDRDRHRPRPRRHSRHLACERAEKRMSNLERERVRDNANKSGLCSTSPPSLTESAYSWHAARTQAGAGEILNVAERGSSQSSNFNVALCMPYSRSLSL